MEDTTDNPAADSHEAAPDSESDEDVEDSYPALTEVLTKLGLPEYVDLFAAEEMDMETFVSCISTMTQSVKLKLTDIRQFEVNHHFTFTVVAVMAFGHWNQTLAGWDCENKWCFWGTKWIVV